MSDIDLATALREHMQTNRQPVDKANKYEFVRGWNEAFDHVERWIKEVTGEGKSNG